MKTLRFRSSILLAGLALALGIGSVQAADAPMDVTYAFWGNEKWGSDPADTYSSDFGKKFNINLKPIAFTWSDWADKLKIWAAAGNLPDLFAHDQPYYQWAKQGLLKGIPVATLKAKYPNVLRYIPQNIQDALTIDGKLYSIPRGHWDLAKYKALDLGGIYVQTAFLKKAGLSSPPATVDEWMSFLRKAVKEDYSGTGKTIGLNTIPRNMFILPFNPEFGYWMKEDGKWIPSQLSKKNLESLKILQKLYQEGVIASDFMITAKRPDDEKRAPFIKGTLAAIEMNADPDMMDGGFITGNAAPNSADGAFITLALPPKAKDGKRYFTALPNYWSYTGINAKVSDEKLDRILRLLNYNASPEGRMYAVYGVEGKDYRMDGTNVVNLLPKDERTGKQKRVNDVYPSADLARFLMSWDLEAAMTNPSHSQAIRDKSTAYFAAVTKETVTIEPNWKIQMLSTPAKDKMVDLNSEYNDMMAKVVPLKGDITKAYNDWVAQQMKKVGTAIKEVNAAVQ